MKPHNQQRPNQQNSVVEKTSNSPIRKMLLNNSTLHENLPERYLPAISESKLKLTMLDILKNTQDRNAWQAPAGFFITFLVTFLSADFKDYYLSGDVWTAMFVLLTIASFVWLVVSLTKIKTKKTVDDVVNEIFSSAGTTFNDNSKKKL